MIDPKQLPLLEDVNLETQDVPGLLEQIKDAQALSLVTKTLAVYEPFKTQNHDQRFSGQDQLYTGWRAARSWPGTNISRSNYSHSLAFAQVESAHPAISEALFGANDWYSVEAFKGTETQKTVLIEDQFRYILTHARNEFGGCAQNELDLSIKDVLYRGNGGVIPEWDPVTKRPIITWVDIRDIFVDPSLTVPNIDEARSVIRRKTITLEALLKLKDVPGMKIPDVDYLAGLAAETPNTPTDTTKSTQEAFRGVNYTPFSSGYSPDMGNRELELLIYYDKYRIIWVVNRRAVVYNETNPYGFIPLCVAPCYIYPGRFYAQGVIDVIESSQRYIESLLNSRLDQVHLSLEPPRMMNRMTNATPSNNAWHPNKIIMVDQEKDYQLLQPQDVLPNVFQEIEFISMAAERQTGINSFGQAVPRPGNVNRTATGVNAQTAGNSLRLYPIVKNIENYLLLPLLYKLYHMIRVHTSAYDQLDAKSAEGNLYTVPASIFDAKVNFRINAASKMVTKEKLQQTLPFVMQYLLNGPMMAQLAQAGKTLDTEEFLRLFQDATGTGSLYKLIRPMTPQEQQMLQQKEQQAMQAQMQEKQQEHQVRLQVTRETNQKDLQIAQMKTGEKENPMMAQMEAAKMQMEMQKSVEESKLEAQAQQAKIAFERELATIKIAAEREKARQQTQQNQIQALLKRQEAESNIQLKRVAAENDVQTKAVANQQNIQNSQQKFQQELQIQKEKATAEKLYKPRLNASTEPEKPRKRPKKSE